MEFRAKRSVFRVDQRTCKGRRSERVQLPTSSDDAVLQAVMDAHDLFAALGIADAVARQQFAWRCEALTDHIAAGLKKWFVFEGEAWRKRRGARPAGVDGPLGATKARDHVVTVAYACRLHPRRRRLTPAGTSASLRFGQSREV